jgi:hypothetical protein
MRELVINEKDPPEKQIKAIKDMFSQLVGKINDIEAKQKANDFLMNEFNIRINSLQKTLQ